MTDDKTIVIPETEFDPLLWVREELKVPKLHNNSFGGFNYRTMEDILEAAKPLCSEVGCKLLITDEILLVGKNLPVTTGERDTKDGKGREDFILSAPRFYVKTTATFMYPDGETWVQATGLAREPVEKKGMDDSQITGTAASYAGKRALGNLFLLDDNKDADDLPATEDDEIAEFLDDYANENIFKLYRLKIEDHAKWQALLRNAPPKGKLTEYRKQAGEMAFRAYEQAGEWAKALTTVAIKGDRNGIKEITDELTKDQKAAVWIQLPEAIKRKIQDILKPEEK